MSDSLVVQLTDRKEAGVTVDMGDDEGGAKSVKPIGPSKSRGHKDWGARMKAGWLA